MGIKVEVPYLDYFGLAEYKQQVNQEPIITPSLLIEDIHRLQGTIPEQESEKRRSSYLETNLRAIETVVRRLLGEKFSLYDEVAGCYDICVDWLPESIFEKAYSLYDEGLPGQGNLRERLSKWQREVILKSDASILLRDFMTQAINHRRNLTQAVVSLPQDESVEITTVYDKSFRGKAIYDGNHHSRILVNLEIPFPLTIFRLASSSFFEESGSENKNSRDAIIS